MERDGLYIVGRIGAEHFRRRLFRDCKKNEAYLLASVLGVEGKLALGACNAWQGAINIPLWHV